MSGPRFTVLMPTHYRPDVVGHAIRSVLAQTEPDFELLVVGDGAAPGTAEVVESFDDPRVRWLDYPKAPNYGYANRNRALRESRGELVAYTADDDLMLPDHLELHGKALKDSEAQWSCSLALWVSEDGIAGPDLTNLDFDDEFATFTTSHNTISGGAFAYRASAFLERATWPEQLATEGDLHIMRELLRRHGRPALRRFAVPTFLHFTAGTKKVRHSHFGALWAWLEVADEASWWPTTLRLPPASTGVPPQAAYGQLLLEDRDAPKRMRAAAADVANRIALEVLDGPGRKLTRISRITAAERAEMMTSERESNLRAQLEAAKAEVAALRASTSWRITQPLRSVGRLIRGD